jgi:hypothetical protein
MILWKLALGEGGTKYVTQKYCEKVKNDNYKGFKTDATLSIFSL